MKMTRNECLRRFPNSSEATLRLNCDDRDTGEAPKLERPVGDAALGKKQVQRPASGRFLVRVTSVRSRLLDEDNLCEKYHVDCCRYAGFIPSDAPGTTKIEVSQEKAGKDKAEFTRIEIYQITEEETQPNLL